MKFLIQREDYGQFLYPGATIETYPRVEMRTCATEEEFDRRFGEKEGPWRSKGVNHRRYANGIMRDHPGGNTGMFIEVNTLDELMKMVREFGSVSVSEYEGYPLTITVAS